MSVQFAFVPCVWLGEGMSGHLASAPCSSCVLDPPNLGWVGGTGGRILPPLPKSPGGPAGLTSGIGSRGGALGSSTPFSALGLAGLQSSWCFQVINQFIQIIRINKLFRFLGGCRQCQFLVP